MINYHIYLILKKRKKELYSNILKSLVFFFIRLKLVIEKILDFGNYFYFNKIKRLFYLNIFCNKKIIKKIFKILKNKNDIIFNFIIIKKNLNFFINNFNIFKNIISKKMKIISSIKNNLNYKIHNTYSKIIKNLKIINIIPNSFLLYIKKINFLYV